MNPEPLSIPLEGTGGWVDSLNINLVSPYAAAQEAVKPWRELDEKDVPKAFIHRGNCSTRVAAVFATIYCRARNVTIPTATVVEVTIVLT